MQLFVTEGAMDRIRRITVDNALVPATQGYASDLLVNVPGSYGVAMTTDSSTYYLTSYNQHVIRKVTVANSMVQIAAGYPTSAGFKDGVGNSALFNNPTGIAINPAGNTLYVVDQTNARLRKIIITGSGTIFTVSTLVGRSQGCLDGAGGLMYWPNMAALNNAETFVYLTEESHRIRRFELSTGIVRTIAGPPAAIGLYNSYGMVDGIGSVARFKFPKGLVVSYDSTKLFVADKDNNVIRAINLLTGNFDVTTPYGSSIGDNGNIDDYDNLCRFDGPLNVATSGADTLYVLDGITNGFAIRTINLVSGFVTTLAGSSSGGFSGTGFNAQFLDSMDLAVSADGNYMVVTQLSPAKLRHVRIIRTPVARYKGRTKPMCGSYKKYSSYTKGKTGLIGIGALADMNQVTFVTLSNDETLSSQTYQL